MLIFKRLSLILFLSLFSLNNLISMEADYDEGSVSLNSDQEKINETLGLQVIIPKKKLKSFERFNELPGEIRYLVIELYIVGLIKKQVARKVLLNLILVNKEFKNNIFDILTDKDLGELVLEYFNKLVEAEEYVKSYPEKVRKKLINGVDKGNVEEVARLLRGGANANLKSEMGYSLLYVSILKKEREIVKLLLMHNADVNEKDCEGIVPLRHAFWTNDMELIEIILDYNSNVDSQDNVGRTPLIEASRNEDYEKSRLLLHHHANVNIRDKHGRTALLIAVINRDMPMIRNLLVYGADVSIKDNKGYDALTGCNYIINQYQQIASMLSTFQGVADKNSY